jgi:hypothetical protein
MLKIKTIIKNSKNSRSLYLVIFARALHICRMPEPTSFDNSHNWVRHWVRSIRHSRLGLTELALHSRTSPELIYGKYDRRSSRGTPREGNEISSKN